jgi:hypothetical protein
VQFLVDLLAIVESICPDNLGYAPQRFITDGPAAHTYGSRAPRKVIALCLRQELVWSISRSCFIGPPHRFSTSDVRLDRPLNYLTKGKVVHHRRRQRRPIIARGL